MKKFFLSAMAAIAFYSCNSDDDNGSQDSYPSTLHLSSYSYTTGVKLYSKYGEVTDQQAINRWRDGYGETFFVWENYGEIPIDNAMITEITFTHPDTITTNYVGPYRKLVVREEHGYKFCYFVEPILDITQLYPLENIYNNMGVFKYTSIYESLPSTDQYVRKTEGGLVLKGNTNRLELSRLTYAVNRSDSTAWYYKIAGITDNAFDPEVINMLYDGDTIAIQEAKMVYTKQ
ncbi:hypothetical protein ACLI1A_13765 [Flavobacterium sp. RHBU_3]|uniref:hypothetical protein n=1 Tax=Flavobacterium sp. RHBU_3 TaxID=3391184 RepID=UPI0039850F58